MTSANTAPGVQHGRIYWHSNVVDSLIDCEQVQPHEQNPNNGDEEEVERSILANGVYRHIYADRKTKRIVAGHTQYATEVRLQLEDGIDRPVVPVSFVDGRDRRHVLRMMSVDNAAARKAKLDNALQLDLLLDLDGDLEGSGYDEDGLDELQRYLDNLNMADSANAGDLAGDVSDGAFDLDEGQAALTVIIDEDHRADFYKVTSELSFVIDVRDVR